MYKDTVFSNLHTAFDLSSCGIGTQIYAVERLANGTTLSKTDILALTLYNSNYLVLPNILQWLNPTFLPAPTGWIDRFLSKIDRSSDNRANLTFSFLHPHSAEYISFINETNGEFGSGNTDPNFDVFSDTLRVQTLKRGLHKLGCMIAVTEQLVFDANKRGIKVPGSFKPIHNIDEWNQNWQSMYGEPIPSIKDLYLQAKAVYHRHLPLNDTKAQNVGKLFDVPQFSE
jgi:hypothetical protein